MLVPIEVRQTGEHSANAKAEGGGRSDKPVHQCAAFLRALFFICCCPPFCSHLASYSPTCSVWPTAVLFAASPLSLVFGVRLFTRLFFPASAPPC